LKASEQARAALAKGIEVIKTRLPKLDDGDIGGGWLDWIVAQALMKEAEDLIGNEPATVQN
jgi:hypothetical protein